ncbi:hypothetical protein [Hydrogenophaga sp. BPS33]|uniref:hypothetical protein n=1 Tax=Hydrogenophaga sp. BPS33 TaxID=2651974 RepID=UPI00131FF867|nr:hypothetical protein [Hydrogenophaga sp. BPS33]QHE87137.1 hypothetical protein F9K07_20660 [Hydrogenophaga sp. BPS33]
MNHFYLNDVFSLDGKRYRVIGVKPKVTIYGYPIDDANGMPVGWELEKFSSLPSTRLTLVEAPELKRPLVASVQSQQVADSRWLDVKPLLDACQLELLERKSRAQTILRYCDEVGKSDRYVMKLLRLLWRFGIHKSSLVADFTNCGRVTVITDGALVVEAHPPTGSQQIVFAPPSQRSRGRRPVFEDYEPYSYPPKFKEKLIEEIRSMYLKDETVSVRAVEEEVLAKYFAKRDSSGAVIRTKNGRASLFPMGKRPSPDQVKYLIKKAVPIHEAHAARVGDADYRNNISKSDGTVHDDCVGPGDVYEIDATIVDLWLVSRYERSVIIGKATLYLVVDRSTGLIVGFYLSLGKPSWEGAKRAILSIASDWEALCKMAGVRYDEDDWPARRVFPNRFFADQGEGASKKSDVVVEVGGIEVSAAPGASPRRKGLVECSFAMVQVPIKDHMGGYEPQKNVRKRLGKKYHKDACYSLDEMVKPFLQIIIKHNHTIRENAVLDPRLVYQGFEASPINIWNHNIAHSMGRPSRHDFEYMRERLLPTSKGVVKQSGVAYGGLLYSFDAPRYHVLTAYAGRGRESEVIVQYDPARAGDLWVSEKSAPDVIYRASLTSTFSRLEELSWEEVAHLQQTASALTYKGKQANKELRVGHVLDVAEYNQELAQRAKQASRGIPMGTRLAVGKKARVLEAEVREYDHQTSMTAATVAVQGYQAPAVEEPIELDVAGTGDIDGGLDPEPANHGAAERPMDADATACFPPNEVVPEKAQSESKPKSPSSGLLSNLLGMLDEEKDS